jgi:hypothetical protein
MNAEDAERQSSQRKNAELFSFVVLLFFQDPNRLLCSGAAQASSLSETWPTSGIWALKPVNGQHPGESEYRLRRDQPEEGLSHFNSASSAFMLFALFRGTKKSPPGLRQGGNYRHAVLAAAMTSASRRPIFNM